MLTQKQVDEIKSHLERAQNPVFFFDNDPDGLCSFLLLQRFIERGRGVAIKSFPSLDESYFRKIEELNADYVFILDKPLVSEEFFKKAMETNIPIVWIDHHEVDGDAPNFVSYYNPCLNETKTNEPVTVLCYQITKRKDDLWIAVIGAISDGFLPDYYEEFIEKYPELAVKASDPFKILYRSKIGEISAMLNNGLKDTTTNVVNMLRFLIKVKTPFEVLEESAKTYSFHRRSGQIYKKYRAIFEKAKIIGEKSGKLLFFKYSGDLSTSGEIANELMFNFPEKIIAVAYVKGSKVNLSLRGKNIRDRFVKIIKSLDNASGGGHRDAVGGVIQFSDLDKFKSLLEDSFV
jgi:single-stranded DNA-specific DHH superfamily exonuclease